jgi:dephospho-CoA kinase
MKIKIGITGGIGSGKSTVAKIIETIGYPVYYSDQRAKDLMNSSDEIKEELNNHFGLDFYSEGSLNRKLLADKIFQNKDELNFVNQLVHPIVRQDFYVWSENQSSKIVFQESALLFETGNEKNFTATLLITAEDELRIQRVMKRDNCSRASVLERMKNQLPESEKISKATFIIENNETESVIQQTLTIVDKIKKANQI